MLLWPIWEAIWSDFFFDHENDFSIVKKMKSPEIYYDTMIADDFFFYP